MELQSSFEFLGTYAWLFIVLLILFMVITVFLVFQNTQNTYSYCSINSQLQCTNLTAVINSSGTMIKFEIKNDLGTVIGMGNKSIEVFPSFNNVSYFGSCTPTYTPTKNYTYCRIFIEKYFPSIGFQLNSRFNLFYGLCSSCTSSALQEYEVSGSLVVDVMSGSELNKT